MNFDVFSMEPGVTFKKSSIHFVFIFHSIFILSELREKRTRGTTSGVCLRGQFIFTSLLTHTDGTEMFSVTFFDLSLYNCYEVIKKM